ncbi:MAG: hypothetical protein LH478_13590 [Chitinophagaceae bacterium]|nr:hypothetical protein [Chitinophagaceae bacterium]
MLENKKQPAKANPFREPGTLKSLFVIPNPFDEFVRKKKGWFSEIQKLEMKVKIVKKRPT